VSKPFPILANDERDLFDAMAPGDFQPRPRRIPKAAEKKVKINAPELIKSSPQPKPKASADASSRSWYTPAPAQSPTTPALRQSTSNATPRTTPSKVNVGRANPTKEFKNHGHTDSEARRDGFGPAKRHVKKDLISHPDCPWVESPQNRPVRSATWGSCESDKTAVGNVSLPTRGDVKKGCEATSTQETLRPRVRVVSKPLPDLPVFDSVSSRWTASTGSVYDNGSLSYGRVLTMFPEPPNHMPGETRFDDWENPNSLLTPSAFMSCPNTSSSSIDTITPATTKPILKAAPKPKVANVVHQIPRASCSYNQLQDSIVINEGRAYPRASMKGSVHIPSIRTTDAAPTFVNIEAAVWPHTRQTPEDIARVERDTLEWESKWPVEEMEGMEQEMFEMEFGYNPQYKGKKRYQREVDPNELELFGPEQAKKRKWL